MSMILIFVHGMTEGRGLTSAATLTVAAPLRSSLGRAHRQLQLQVSAALLTDDTRNNFRHHVVGAHAGNQVVHVENT